MRLGIWRHPQGHGDPGKALRHKTAASVPRQVQDLPDAHRSQPLTNVAASVQRHLRSAAHLPTL
ncbi:hypothetical protein GCM10011415_41650 [Salipiger pallidus]|uniref:Uncharacterized protein n=1 Tax=Salipiger pallidus TaxID=1775170 RepID=A0A8J2ZND0_9RHOB|nr:hypothetical protein GCM10011415_41650 [Salipiger pallidus]